MRYFIVICWLLAGMFLFQSAQPGFAEGSLVFNVTVNSWSQEDGLTRVSSGSISVLGENGETTTGSIGTDGSLSFQVPADQAATWTLSAGGFKFDGLLKIAPNHG